MAGRTVCMTCNNLVEGHILGQEVRDTQGGVVAPAGTILDQTLLQRISRLGPETVAVREQPPQGQAHAAYSLEANLDYLFRHWQFSPGMRHLHDLLLEYRQGEVSS